MQRPKDNIIEFTTIDDKIIEWDALELINKCKEHVTESLVVKKNCLMLYEENKIYDSVLIFNPIILLSFVHRIKKKKIPKIKTLKVGDLTYPYFYEFAIKQVNIETEDQSLKYVRLGRGITSMSTVKDVKLIELDIKDTEIDDLLRDIDLLHMEGLHVLFPHTIIAAVLNNTTVIGNLSELLEKGTDIDVKFQEPEPGDL